VFAPFERQLDESKCSTLLVHVESKQVFYARSQEPLRVGILESWQPSEGEFEKLVGCVCPTCKETFENSQALGSHVTRLHGGKR
jgi:hypothetical protein